MNNTQPAYWSAPLRPLAPAPYPADALPPVLCNIAEAVARKINAPPEPVYCSTLGAVSAACGKNLVVPSGPPGDDEVLHANLYFLIAAESGVWKSRIFKRIFGPLYDYQKQVRELFKTSQKPTLEREKLMLGKRKEALAQRAKKSPLSLNEQVELLNIIKRLEVIEDALLGTRLICEDITTQALGTALYNNGEMISSLSSEASEALNVITGRYAGEKVTADDNLYVRAFSGDPYTVDRISRPSVDLHCPLMTLFWMTQPVHMHRLFENESFCLGGLLPRFLVYTRDDDDLPPNKHAKPIDPKISNAFNNMLFTLLNEFRNASAERRLPESREIFEFFCDYDGSFLERKIGPDRDIAPFLRRYKELAWRIVLNLHAASYLKDADKYPLSLETAQNAVRIMDWHALEMERALEPRRGVLMKADFRKLWGFLKGMDQWQAPVHEIERLLRWKRPQIDKVVDAFPQVFCRKRGARAKRRGRIPELIAIV
jgi:hypothetical protein